METSPRPDGERVRADNRALDGHDYPEIRHSRAIEPREWRLLIPAFSPVGGRRSSEWVQISRNFRTGESTVTSGESA
jgi:hypothetical protein